MSNENVDKKPSQIIPITIEDEVKSSYLNYAMSVIVSRALPDVRDGLKPVHRRILFSMSDMGLRSSSPHKKTGRIVGDVLGKYHPHGDQSIYDALVRLAQDFSLRYPLIDGQGNFGSIDNDPPAAMRYTEARLTRLSDEMLQDIAKETVDFRPNYDETLKEPSVLPAVFPNLLANGTSGIAVGMATTIPPHNLREITAAVAHFIANPDCTPKDLCQHVKGPDFPTGGVLFGAANMYKVYETGRGQMVLRGSVHIEKGSQDKEIIVITELPYQVNKNALISRIAGLVEEGIIKGISDLRDESDRDGLRISIGVKRDVDAELICNKLYHHTALQTNINSNMLALVDGRPQLLNLRDIILHYVNHRREIITRRTKYDLRINEERKHILDGLLIAIANIDEVIRIIRASKDVAAARDSLIKRFSLSLLQAQAILDMRLQRLTNLEHLKVEQELAEVTKNIKYFRELLASKGKIDALIVQELTELTERFGDDRKTALRDEEVGALDKEELIQSERVVFVLSVAGYAKRVPLVSFRPQSRGGRGSAASAGKDDDLIQNVLFGLTTDYVLIVSGAGKCYKVRLHDIPAASRIAKGRHLRGLISIGHDEKTARVLIVPDFDAPGHLLFVTARGIAKKTAINKFAAVKTRGVIAIKLSSNDQLISALPVDPNQDIFLFSARGKGLRVGSRSFRPMDRSTRGVIAMKLTAADCMVGAVTINADQTILLVTESGFAKRVNENILQRHGRGTGGQIAFPVTEKTGKVVAALAISDGDNVLFATSSGNAMVIKASEISLQQKNARGVRCVQLEDENRIVAVEAISAQ